MQEVPLSPITILSFTDTTLPLAPSPMPRCPLRLQTWMFYPSWTSSPIPLLTSTITTTGLIPSSDVSVYAYSTPTLPTNETLSFPPTRPRTWILPGSCSKRKVTYTVI